MNEPRRELLVIVDTSAPDDALETVRRTARVTQVVPPRIALASATDSAALRALPGVHAIADEPVPSELRAGLSQAEELFVAAWEARARAKERPGDGESWDAPGRSAP
jgi:hypothetical protein